MVRTSESDHSLPTLTNRKSIVIWRPPGTSGLLALVLREVQFFKESTDGFGDFE